MMTRTGGGAARRAVVAAVALMLSGCRDGCTTPPHVIPEGVPEDRNATVGVADPHGEVVQKIVYLDQGWKPGESQRFYFTAQGSEVIPYDWFLALEQPEGAGKFRDDAHLSKFRYLVQRPDAMNPDGLPVGFVKDQGRDRAWLGLTCAACHATQIDHEGVGYRIDGGPALADVEGFLRAVSAALRITRDRPDKFDRFATAVLGAGASEEKKETLRKQMAEVLARREGYEARNFPAERPGGYGRVDALGAILNEVFYHVLAPDDRTTPTVNAKPADAPVSYPPLWDTPQHDKVQYIGAAENGGVENVGNLGRNVGEVLGVFGDYEIPASTLNVLYPSTVKVPNLHALDGWLVNLWSPPWPEAFGKPDAEKAAAGAKLYDRLCLDCHDRIDRKSPTRKVAAKMRFTGTDPRTSDNFFNRQGRSGRLEGRFPGVKPSLGPKFGATIAGSDALKHVVIGTILGSPFKAPEDALTRIEWRARAPGAFAVAAFVAGPEYKARPLNGAWATAPYLHNGSVPNLYSLLLPADERPRRFGVGSRKFDPKHVGLSTETRGFFEYRARADDGSPIPGNSNAGHEYGTDLSDPERWQLVEYLKTL